MLYINFNLYAETTIKSNKESLKDALSKDYLTHD
jgi:hypothetical protein